MGNPLVSRGLLLLAKQPPVKWLGTARQKEPPSEAALEPSARIRFARTLPRRLDGWERTQPRPTTTSKNLPHDRQRHFLFELRGGEFALLDLLCGLHVCFLREFSAFTTEYQSSIVAPNGGKFRVRPK